jgi:hypothetical protein
MWWIQSPWLIGGTPVAHVKCDRRPVRRLTIEAAVRLPGSVSRPVGLDRAPIRGTSKPAEHGGKRRIREPPPVDLAAR